MSDENKEKGQNGQKSNANEKKQQQPEVRVFIGPPQGDHKLVVAEGKEGEYTIMVQLGQSRQPATNQVAVKVLANDTPIGQVQMVKSPSNYIFQNVKLDASQEITLFVRRIGQEKPDDSLPPINLTKVNKVESAKSKKRFEVVVGPLNSSRVQSVTFITLSDKLEKEKGTVVFSLGQRAIINGSSVKADHVETVNTSDGTAGSDPLGMRSVAIKLHKQDDTITFRHIESGEEVVESLLFEP